MAPMPLRLKFFIIFLLTQTVSIQTQKINKFDSNDKQTLTLLSKRVDEARIKSLENKANKLAKNPDTFYDYSIVCGSDVDPRSRVQNNGQFEFDG